MAHRHDKHTTVCASVHNSRGSSVHTQSKSQRRRKSFFISAVHYYIISGCRRLQLTSCEGDHVQWRPSLSSSSRAFRRARSRPACMRGYASSRARERGQESIRELAGLVRGPACRPAKGSCPIHRRPEKARVLASAPPGRRKHHRTLVQPRGKYCNHASSTSLRVGTRSPGCTPLPECCAGVKR